MLKQFVSRTKKGNAENLKKRVGDLENKRFITMKKLSRIEMGAIIGGKTQPGPTQCCVVICKTYTGGGAPTISNVPGPCSAITTTKNLDCIYTDATGVSCPSSGL